MDSFLVLVRETYFKGFLIKFNGPAIFEASVRVPFMLGFMVHYDSMYKIILAATKQDIPTLIMPKSEVDYYDGSDAYLKIPSQLLGIFEVGSKNK